MTHKLLSLPPNLVGSFHEITGLSAEEYYCNCDPVGHRLGSGGGTTWLLRQCHKDTGTTLGIDEWLAAGRRIILHAGGQSRRLPAYAPSGKILTPVPVFRWERGQRLSQDLLSLQLPLYERLMAQAPAGLNTMIVSGDVYIQAPQQLPTLPQADVVCLGLWLDAEVASHHGVFYSTRQQPSVLNRMYQKPSTAQLSQMLHSGYYLTDIGVWILSDRAVKLLMQRSEERGEYDLYSEFGCALGTAPSIEDKELNALSVAIVPLEGGEFYHYGTSPEMISSTVKIQNRVGDQRAIMHHDRKPHPSIFVQNAVVDIKLTASNVNTWIENSHICHTWQLTHDNIITGVPHNNWDIALEPGECIDVVPIGQEEYVLRRYHINDKFAGDEQQRPQFPVIASHAALTSLNNIKTYQDYLAFAATAQQLLSAEQISDRANLKRLFEQRTGFRQSNWTAMARNWQHSVFYQLDLDDAARAFAADNIPLPEPLPLDAPIMTRIADAMFRGDKDTAFGLLREGLTSDPSLRGQQPRLAVCSDQIVWGRSPVRIDISGGWTDTPPFCLMEGGNVVNLAIELNGQQPLQAYVKPCRDTHIILRSIDLGASETVTTYAELADFMHVGSPFAIPKAALVLAGFYPDFSGTRYNTLQEQLADFGCGIEVTLLSAVPAGSGLGTSSILASTVLGAVADFCSLPWDKAAIARRTLVLEQLLTTGGGWQDQYGGVLGGVKLLQTQSGFNQDPVVRWLPTDVFTNPEYAPCHLLYYTGITRTAKHLLAEIVRRMFLNQGDQLLLLREMKQHALRMAESIQRGDFCQTGELLRQNWLQNQALDAGTNPDAVRRITDMVDDLCLGYKLPGAGGGGFIYMIARDPDAALRIRQTLIAHRINSNARFVDMTLSRCGLQVTRS